VYVGEDQVHGLYQEHYAFREAMTDVVIQNLIEDEKVGSFFFSLSPLKVIM
jgi:hypothetical protein